ncbi:MerR family transcriptional regulator [Aliikangiella marina]|uniref:MerR family transcriptional regulator n=1 Tax=Aliikangiella marina TaxID=1712262 RepID=A0A545TDF1_9GAMM|nr:MerR family transcriptional regulator [Aliikangiella marina]TQV75257.1 MerR family transcriptional regulator [Aliikangiella marina]
MLSDNQSFSIGTVARIIGVSTHTLRAWEKRYDLNLAQRNASGRREYPAGEIEKLKMIKSVLKLGYKISDVAHLSINELAQLKSNESSPSEGGSSQSKKRRVLIYGKKLSHLVFQSRTNIRYQVFDELIDLADLVESESAIVNGVVLSFNKVDAEIEELIYTIKLGFKRQLPLIVFSETPLPSEIAKRLSDSHIETIDEGFDLDIVKETLRPERFEVESNAQPKSSLNKIQVGKLLDHKSDVYCECPNHLADVYTKLDEFITYTKNCEILSPKDAAVHQHINQKLQEIQGNLTQLVWDVAELDGIDL